MKYFNLKINCRWLVAPSKKENYYPQFQQQQGENDQPLSNNSSEVSSLIFLKNFMILHLSFILFYLF